MKPIAFLSLLFLSVSLQAQEFKTSISKSFNDNGKTLSIKVKANLEDRKIDYFKEFNVEGWSKAERAALVKTITDSLGVPNKRRVVQL